MKRTPIPRRGLRLECVRELEMGSERKEVLLTDAEALDQRLVALEITPLEVIQQPPPLPHELEKLAPRMMIFRGRLEMLGQVHDAVAEQRDLHLGRARIGVVAAIRLYDVLRLRLCAARSFSHVLLVDCEQ